MSLLRRLFRREGPPRQERWLHVREEDIPDPEERAFYELALNAAMTRGEGVVTARDPRGGVIVDGRSFDSVEDAAATIRAVPKG